MAKNRPEQAGSGRRADGTYAPGHSGNASGRRGASSRATAQERADGWQNLLTGMGTQARDKREAARFRACPIDHETARELYLGDDMGARIVEAKPDEMVREGFDLCISDGADDGVGPEGDYDQATGQLTSAAARRKMAETRARLAGYQQERDWQEMKAEVEQQWEELGLIDKIHTALCYERAYGGAAILVGARDGSSTLAEPLALDNVRSVDFLTVLEAREIAPLRYYGDPQAPKYGQPAIYQLTPFVPGNTVDRKVYAGVTEIHETRLLVFPGIRVSNILLTNGASNGWGDSVFTRVYQVLRDFQVSWGSVASILSGFAQAVYSMDGLTQALEADSADLFKRRIQGMWMAQATTNLTIVDAKDKFERIVTPVSGLDSLLDRFMTRLAAAAETPVSVLAGESPGGINASGASGDQLRLFYDRVRAAQKKKCVPAIRRVTRMLMAALGGEPAQWTVEPRPLWQPTQAEQITSRGTQAEIDVKYMDRGVLTADEVRANRFGGKSYSYDTTLTTPDVATITDDDVAAYKAEQPPKAGTTQGAAPATTVAPTGSIDVQKQALNGAQTAAMTQIVEAVCAKQMPIETAEIMLEVCFQISPADAARLLAPARDFEAPKPDPTPVPFGAPAEPTPSSDAGAAPGEVAATPRNPTDQTETK